MAKSRIEAGGQIFVGGGKLDAQFVNIDGGRLLGSGEIFVGTGPIHGVVRNHRRPRRAGHARCGRQLTIDGDFSQLDGGTLEIDLGGTVRRHAIRSACRRPFAFLDGTLEVSLIDSAFTPSVGNAFTILTAGEECSAQFDNLLLPGGFQWNVVYNANNVVLSVVGLGLAGDYNGDGAVDAADYVVWRNSMGATGSSLPADGNGDQVVNQDDYLVWRSNFGKSSAGAGSATISITGVPEPGGLMLGVCAAAVGVVGSRLSRKRLI